MAEVNFSMVDIKMQCSQRHIPVEEGPKMFLGTQPSPLSLSWSGHPPVLSFHKLSWWACTGAE